MRNIIKLAKNMIKMDKVIPGKEGYYDVDGEIVRKWKEKGKTLISCSCKSCSNSKYKNNICSRKMAVILLEAQDPKLKFIIREGLEYIGNCKRTKMIPETSYTWGLLNDLKSFI